MHTSSLPPPRATARGRHRDGARRCGPVSLGFAALTGAFLLMAAVNPMGTTIHGDGYYTYLWARSIVFDGDLDFHDDYRLCGDPWGLAANPVGEDVNYWSPGPAIFWVPILAFDRLTGHEALDSPDPQIANACRGPMAERAVRGSLVAGLLALLLGFAFARRYFGDGPALFGTLGVGLLGSLLYYSAMMPSYGHAASACAAGLAVVAWERHRREESLLGWALSGAALGFAVLTRAQNAVLVVLPLGTWLYIAYRHLAPSDGAARSLRGLLRHVGHGVVFTLLVFVVFSPQLWFWHHSTGSWVTVPQGSGYMRWAGSMPHKALFSAQGLFAWTPIHYLSLVGFVAMALRSRTRALGIGLLVLFAVESFVVGAAYDWNGSVGFPGRRFDALVVPFAFGLAAFGRELWRATQRRRGGALTGLAWVSLLGLFAWNASVTVGVARGMRTDSARRSTTQWSDAFGQVNPGIWQAVGNPLTWPASLPFALRYGAHPRRWDVIGGPELFHHDERTLLWRERESTIDFVHADARMYLDGRVDDRAGAVRDRRGVVVFPGSSRLLLPIHLTDLGFLHFRITPLRPGGSTRIAATINGVRLGTARVPDEDGAEVSIPVPYGVTEQGINEVWIWVDGGSVLLERLQLRDPEPPPSERARRENAELRRERAERLGRAAD